MPKVIFYTKLFLRFAFFPSAPISNIGMHIFIYKNFIYISDYFLMIILRSRITGQREGTLAFDIYYLKLLSRKAQLVPNLYF